MATLYFGTTLINQAEANVATVVESLTTAEYEALAVKDPNTLYVLTDVANPLDSHAADTDIHVTAAEKSAWNSAVETHNTDAAAHADIRTMIENKKGAQVYEATIGTSWTEDSDTGVKYQTVSISGVTADSTAKIDHGRTVANNSDDLALYVEEENQYLTYITNGFAETVAGGIKFAIFGDPNTVNIPIVVEVV